MGRATSLTRVTRGQAEWWRSDERREGLPFLEDESVATPGGMLVEPRERRSVVDSTVGCPLHETRCTAELSTAEVALDVGFRPHVGNFKYAFLRQAYGRTYGRFAVRGSRCATSSSCRCKSN
jgi:hypothetical protein